MREVKFRGLSVETGKWLYGVPLISGNDAFIITVDNRICDLSSSVIKDSVGQYTGLKDENGVEIYEGDVGFDNHSENDGIVKFIEGKYVYEWDNICEDLCEVNKDMEIIGNIYEHSHLLEGETNE